MQSVSRLAAPAYQLAGGQWGSREGAVGRDVRCAGSGITDFPQRHDEAAAGEDDHERRRHDPSDQPAAHRLLAWRLGRILGRLLRILRVRRRPVGRWHCLIRAWRRWLEWLLWWVLLILRRRELRILRALWLLWWLLWILGIRRVLIGQRGFLSGKTATVGKDYANIAVKRLR